MVSTPSCRACAISRAPGRGEAARGWAWTDGASSCTPRRWEGTWKGEQTVWEQERVHALLQALCGSPEYANAWNFGRDGQTV